MSNEPRRLNPIKRRVLVNLPRSGNKVPLEIVCLKDDHEACDFAEGLASAFAEAGWKIEGKQQSDPIPAGLTILAVNDVPAGLLRGDLPVANFLNQVLGDLCSFVVNVDREMPIAKPLIGIWVGKNK